jgi:glycosyltransferase involved in cell wall biosynthesis
MKIAIATVQVPFIRGGAEVMTQGLQAALIAAGHSVETITLPFNFSPLKKVCENIGAWQQQDFAAFDCGNIDHVIALKFPAYYLDHNNKTVWLIHQHRAVYELYDTPYGENSASLNARLLREKVIELDSSGLGAAEAIYTISKTVSDRLRLFNKVESIPLYQPPPQEQHFHFEGVFPFVFFPSRLESLKRQDLLIRAMQKVKEPVFAIIAGEGGEMAKYQKLSESLGLSKRIQFVGRVEDNVMRKYYSNALAVFFGPYAEDYGFITLEAMLSAKPVITCTDSGGPTEFISNGETGHVVDPDPEAIADAINQLWANRNRAVEMGNNALSHYKSMNISWQNVVNTLIAGHNV